MDHFIGGKELCRRFFTEAAKPVLERNFPQLAYTAGLLGYGSDVIGYDDAVSTDHMWGPRFYLFLREEDMAQKDRIMEAFSNELPVSFMGYSVNFSVPDPNDGGIRHAEMVENGPVSPLIFIRTIKGFLEEYIGTANLDNLSDADWLSFSEHKLLGLRSGKLYVDMLGLGKKLESIFYYPDYIWRFQIASQWAIISEEQAFVKRCGSRGDELGSRIVCARIADRLMRLCFLYAKTYAPYSKWYGTAFSRMDINSEIKDSLIEALSTGDLLQREEKIAVAQSLVADIHNASGITEPVSYQIESYFGRDIKVIFSGNFAAATAKALAGTSLEKLPLTGSLCQVGNLVELTDDVAHRERLRLFHSDL